MSRYFGLLFHEYWDGRTGKQIAAMGGAPALLLGAYLMGNRHDNMIGLYRLPLDEIRLPLVGEQVVTALGVLEATEFAHYDYATEFVWVHEMARIRLGLRTREDILSRRDNRLRFVHSLYAKAEDNPFLRPFFERYASTFHLKTPRTTMLVPHAEPLGSPLQAPSKGLASEPPDRLATQPLNVQEPDTFSNRNKESTKYLRSDQGSVIRDQDQGSGIRDQDQKITAARTVHAREAGTSVGQTQLLDTISTLRKRIAPRPVRRSR